MRKKNKSKEKMREYKNGVNLDELFLFVAAISFYLF